MGRLKISPVVKMPIEVQATTALRNAIVSGAIRAGERITEIQISQQMNLSRATVRTALHQLAKEGLLTLVPYTGWTVVSLSAEDVWELYTLRSAVERLAAQLVASTITPAKAARLTEALDVLIQECKRGDTARIAEADFGLHKTIVLLTDHGRLGFQYGLIEQQTRMHIRSSYAIIPSPKRIIEDHRPIVEAICAGKADLAGRLSEQHHLAEGEKHLAHLKRLEKQEPAKTSAAAPRSARKRAPAT
ncbi:GntR family transcriptional regulator [Bradyrhizobium sp. WSM3983]|uniref:GntR family transcriptional regulator n=1 Tax=Bradyrhizobium sp. WSM3983 TaxID=1038867 RepID=UPI00047F164F|nr:GntR family transcriptional regulator [Bradyrhizobium sp. WSM3983]